MSVVPLIPVTTVTKTASFLFLRTNTPCNSSLGSCPAGVLAGAGAGAGLPLLSVARSARWRMVNAWIGMASELLRVAVVMRAVADNPGRTLGGGSWRATTTLKSLASGLADGVLRTDRGEYRFDRLALTTGARPVALPGTGRQRFLRTIDDALELRQLLLPGLRLAIVGAGWIGAELATAAAARGCRVTVLEAAA